MRTILISQGVSSGDKIKYFFCFNGIWVAFSQKDHDLVYKNWSKTIDDGFFVPISEDDLYLKYPLLKGSLKEQEEKFISIDHEHGTIHVNPKHDLKFLKSSARASNQANVKADFWFYIINKEEYFVKLIWYAVILIFASFIISWGLIILLFWVVFYSYYKVLADLDIYYIGTLNPAIVVSTKPTRIAVFVNSSMGLGYYPLVRVYKTRLPKEYNKLNQRIPAVCGYKNVFEQKFWDYIIPHPIVNAINDIVLVDKKIHEIPPNEWLKLKLWIRTNQDKYYEGYYPIKDKSNGWSKIEKPKFLSYWEEKRTESNK